MYHELAYALCQSRKLELRCSPEGRRNRSTSADVGVCTCTSGCLLVDAAGLSSGGDVLDKLHPPVSATAAAPNADGWRDGEDGAPEAQTQPHQRETIQKYMYNPTSATSTCSCVPGRAAPANFLLWQSA